MKTSLYALLSPAKLMDETQRYQGKECTQPFFLEEAKTINTQLKKLKVADIKKLMVLSDELAAHTEDRIKAWKSPMVQQHASLAIQLFKGEVYRGLDAPTLHETDLSFAQEHIGILSGLYGLLRAKDLVLPYRLMMGTSFAPTSEDKTLYRFWSQKITQRLNDVVDSKGYIVNLASDEYFKVIDRKQLEAKVITCEFLEVKNDVPKMVSTFAKQARGMMARYIIDEKLTSPTKLKKFARSGYSYQKELSTDDKLIFIRPSK